MENPIVDIAKVLAPLFSPTTPEIQIMTIEKYFTSDASLSHPLCYIPASHNSRERIIRAYAFLRIIAPNLSAKIRRQSFNDTKGKMSLEMEFTPTLRGTSTLSSIHEKVIGGLGIVGEWIGEGEAAVVPTVMPTIPVHVFLTLKRDLGIVGPWRIVKQEVLFQPVDILLALHLPWLASLIYYFFWLILILTMLVGHIFRAWNHKEFSVYNEVSMVARDGYEVMVLTPTASVLWAAHWGVGKTRDGLQHLWMRHGHRVVILKHGWRWFVWKVVRKAMF